MKIEHFIIGGPNLTQEGEVAGFKAGDRVIYADGCFPHLRGTKATVIGFDSENKIWTQPDGQTGCNWTPEEFALVSLKRIA
ncbi:MAG TPA: hypothetical protein PKZ02_02245 [Candidatus Paceibacterota bacterium]|nr:hypothetical protein [Candidatus Paceibacterota bacterium]HRZ51525.1 hypothetical protein [Candidatus Paceibacterota bacterium]HSA37250.1 hypothetical protein [Candidatus Paceibacterota bacterium]